MGPMIATVAGNTLVTASNAVLGAVAGLMLRAFPRWSAAGGENPNNSRLWIFVGAFSAVVLSALVAPYASALLGRLTGFETPYANFCAQTAFARFRANANLLTGE
jgi:hypothetical protein